MGIKIGNIETRNNVFLAPMSGITDEPFRAIAHEAGAGLVVSEMVASEELVRERPDMMRRARGHKKLTPFVMQLAGREAKWMSEGTRVAQDLGADIIDINMGCPARQVTGGLSGSALMRDLDHALTLIEATIAAAKVPVTLKMRLGWDEKMLNAPELARRKEPLEASPLDTVVMVGSLIKVGQPVALVRVDNLLYQVRVGNYLGQNYGRITKVSETGLSLREIVQDAAGEWIERTATLQLQEVSK